MISPGAEAASSGGTWSRVRRTPSRGTPRYPGGLKVGGSKDGGGSSSQGNSELSSVAAAEDRSVVISSIGFVVFKSRIA